MVGVKKTVKVDELMIIERYSHVMHIVSNVISKLSKKKDAFDVLKATLNKDGNNHLHID